MVLEIHVFPHPGSLSVELCGTGLQERQVMRCFSAFYISNSVCTLAGYLAVKLKEGLIKLLSLYLYPKGCFFDECCRTPGAMNELLPCPLAERSLTVTLN